MSSIYKESWNKASNRKGIFSYDAKAESPIIYLMESSLGVSY